MTKWRISQLGELCSLITDGKHGDCTNEADSGFYFISAKDVRDGRLWYENARQITESDFAETHRRTDLQAGDILLTNSGTIGRLAIAIDEEITRRTTFQKSVAVLKPLREKLGSRFLYYYLVASVSALENAARGAAQKNLLLSELRRLPVIVPPLSQQERIASILSAYDEQMENNRRRMGLLEKAARLLYEEWFVRLRFPGHEHTPNPHGFPQGWEKKALGDLADVVMGQSPESKFYNESGEGLPFHQGVAEFGERFVTNRVFTTAENRVAFPGDVLCSVRAPVGRLNVTLDKIVIGRGLSALRSRSGYQSFLFYQLNTHFFKEDLIGAGAIFASVTKMEFKNQKMLTPPEPLIKAFEEVTVPIDQQLRVLHLQNQKLSAARDLLLPRLMSREIEV